VRARERAREGPVRARAAGGAANADVLDAIPWDTVTGYGQDTVTVYSTPKSTHINRFVASIFPYRLSFA
jgi:hypothetical protein